jgi:hypothetical protein
MNINHNKLMRPHQGAAGTSFKLSELLPGKEERMRRCSLRVAYARDKMPVQKARQTRNKKPALIERAGFLFLPTDV